MRANRRRDTLPELRVRRILHARGLRYLVDTAPAGIRAKADIVFTRRKIAVFIDGCFWHQCEIHGTLPRANADYWTSKLARNVKRDRLVNRELAEIGWEVLRYWEHEDPTAIADSIAAEWVKRVPDASPHPVRQIGRTIEQTAP